MLRAPSGLESSAHERERRRRESWTGSDAQQASLPLSAPSRLNPMGGAVTGAVAYTVPGSHSLYGTSAQPADDVTRFLPHACPAVKRTSASHPALACSVLRTRTMAAKACLPAPENPTPVSALRISSSARNVTVCLVPKNPCE